MSRTPSSLGPIAAAALLAFTAPHAAYAEDDAKPARNAAGEAELSEMLEGRIAGEPERCLSDNQRRNIQIIDRTAFVFRDRDVIYVNRPNGARFLDDFDVPVFRLHGSQLCRLDQVELRDRSLSFGGPLVAMSDFIPYRLEKDNEQ